MIFGQDRYNKFSMLLHWMVAILVLVLICLGMFMHDIPKGDPDRAFFFNLHKSIGVTAGLIMFIRLWWRHKNPPPPLPSSLHDGRCLCRSYLTACFTCVLLACQSSVFLHLNLPSTESRILVYSKFPRWAQIILSYEIFYSQFIMIYLIF